MNMGLVSLSFALLVSFLYVDARNIFVFKDVGEKNSQIYSSITHDISYGKSTKDTPISSHHGSATVDPVILSSEGLSPEFICLSCLEVSRKAEEILTYPQLPEKVGVFANDACHILPSDLQVKCVEVLEMYAHQAILLLQVYFSEQNLCNSTSLCPLNANTLPMVTAGSDQQLSAAEAVHDLMSGIGANTRVLTKLPRPFSALKSFIVKISDGRSCATCQRAMDELRNDLENPEMKIKVIRILLKACENVENHVNQCKKMVFEYGPMVLSNLEKYLSSNDLCCMIHLCEDSAPHTSETVKGFGQLQDW